MKKDLDEKLYNDYFNGEKEAFELLYNKYKNRIEYFIYNIVKDYQKAEDLTQETFIYIIQNKMRKNSSFKFYIYLVAKSKALNYINVEKRREEIKEQYFCNKDEQVDKDILEVITKEETKKEVLEAIEQLDEKYKNAIYLVNIEGLSYKETSDILGENLQNTKNLIHRGKKQLRKILLKKGFDKMNKSSKILVMVICISTILSGVVYATTVIYKKYNMNNNVTMNPTYESTINENTINNLWVGTLDLAWKDLKEKIGQDKIELEENVEILFYNRTSNKPQDNDFAVKLKTQEGDEIILYRTDENKSFEEYYNDIKNKTNAYTGNREFAENDELIVPYVRVNGIVSYDELYNKKIKNTNGLYIFDVIQNVKFSLNEKGNNIRIVG